jgi:hypothetical protein
MRPISGLVRRRLYRMPRGRWATCEDCGRLGFRVTVVRFFGGMFYRVCRDCIKPYRGHIIGPSAITNERTKESI